MPTADEIAAAVWARKVTASDTAGACLVVGQRAASDALSRINTVILDPNHPQSLPGILGQVDTVEESLAAHKLQVAALPTAQQVADAVLAAGGGGGLTRDQLVAVLNQTGLQVQEG